MKRNIILCILLALTVLCLLTFSSCEGGGIHIDTGSETDTDGDIINTDSNTGNTSTDTEGGDTTDTDTEGGNTTDTDTEGGSGNEDGEDGGNQGGSGDDNQGGNQGGSGDDNQGGNQGGSGNEDGGNGGDINQGDEGGNENPTPPTTYTDSDGFVYIEENGALVCVDFVRPVDATTVVYMKSEYMGLPVVGIRTNAFTDFGIAFQASEYKNASYYYTIAIPTSIKSVEAAAFELCYGIRIALYVEVQDTEGVKTRLLDSSIKNDLSIILDWESKLTLFDRSEKSNRQARDTIWGFRPALGWTRYSAVEIPDFYE